MYLKILCDSRETNLLTVCHRFLSLDQKKKRKRKKEGKKIELDVSLRIDSIFAKNISRYRWLLKTFGTALHKKKKRKKGTTFDKMIDDTRNEIRKLEINNSSDLPRFCNVSSYEMGFFFSLFFPKLLNHSRLESC